MATVVVTLKVMPDSPEVDLSKVELQVKTTVAGFGGEVGKTEVQPIAFGLKALIVYFVMDEAKGATDELEKKISSIKGVSSVDVTDVRRAIG